VNKAPEKSFLPENYTGDMIEWAVSVLRTIPVASVTETVSEFAERTRSLPLGLTGKPGPFTFDNAPYTREIADRFSILDPAQEIVFVSGTQVGKTVNVIENGIAYYINYGIGPQNMVSGDQRMAEDQMATRIDDVIQSCGIGDKIQPMVTKKSNKQTGDRKDMKMYSGTFLRAFGPNSESKMRSFPSPINWLDEIDVYKTAIVKDGRSTGSPIDKIVRRSDSYPNKKIYYTSTPKEYATSQIWPLYEQGDKREYRFKCPHCGHEQAMHWKNIAWDKDENDKLLLIYKEIDGEQHVVNDPVYLYCESDKKCIIRNSEKYDMLLEEGRGGSARWVATKKPDRPGLYSYHINALYGFRTWLDIVIQFERVKHDPVLLIDFINDVLGEPSRDDDAQKPDEHVLMRYAEEWPRGHISEQVKMLTLGCDLQKNRIEAMLTGWGRNRQAWIVNYYVFEGDPAVGSDKCWKELEKLIATEFVKQDSGEVMGITLTMIDEQFLGDSVRAFCDQYTYTSGVANGVYPVLVREQLQGERLKVQKMDSTIAAPVLALSDQPYKKLIYEILRKRRPRGDGTFPHSYIHFSEEYGIDFYKQLTAEEVVFEKDKHGRVKRLILNTKRRRNEVLDTLKYSYAGFNYCVDEFFEAVNKKRRLEKKREIEKDLDYFFDVLEGVK
jgi:phage terminase large subunit GpA-like protein